jgi:TP901 family phage tail tape measure protein
LNNKLTELNAVLQKAEIGSKEFVIAQKEIAQTQDKLNAALKGFSSNENSIQGLTSKLSELNAVLQKAEIGSKEFVAAQREIAQTQEQLNAALKGFQGNENSIQGLNNKLTELNAVLQKAEIGSKEFVIAQKEIAQTQDKLNAALKGFQGNEKSIEGLNNKLAEYNKALQKAEVGSKEFVAAQKGVAQTQREINTALKGFDGNETSIRGLRERLSELNQTLEKTAIGSKEFVATQRQIALTQKDVDKALGTASGIIGRLGQELKGFALQAGAVLSAGSALQFVGKQITELDSAGAAVRTLGINSNELKDKLFNLSIELDSNVSRVELLKASYDVASSGFTTTAQITDILKASSLGASGGFAELNDVTKAVTGVINAYGLTTADATGIVDGFVQTQADGVITVRQYAEQIGTVASVAAAAGIPISELNAAIATATLKGVPVAQSFTGIRQAISSILKPSEQAKDLAASLGISFDLAGLQARGFGGFLADVQAKGGGAADKLAILLGSVEAQAAVQPLLNDGLKSYNQLLDNQVSSAGAAAKAAELATDTIAGGIKKIENATSNLATTVGESLPEVANYLGTLAKIIELSAKFNKEVAPTINAGAQQNVAPLVSAITDAAKAFQAGTKDLFLYEKALGSVKLGYAGLITAVQGFILGNDGAKKASLDFQKQLIELTGLNKLFNTESAKQAEIVAKANQQKEIAKILAKDLLDKQTEQNRLSLIEIDNAIALQGAKDKLNKTQADGLISIRQADINLGQALVGLEESRYSIIQNRNNYELQEARERGASEAEIEGIKRQGEVIEAAALSSKYQALVEQQGLERQLLDLKQQQALVEANKEARKANTEYRKAEIEYDAARLANLNENSNLTQEALDKARETLEIKGIERQDANENLDILKQMQPIQDKIADASEEEQINRLLSTAAAKGLQLSAGDIFLKTKGAAGEFKTLGNSMKVPLGQQDAFTQLARDMGFAVRDTGKGYVEIGKDLNTTNKTAANDIKAYMSIVAKSTQAAKTQTGGLANNMSTAANAAERFYNALSSASGLPPARFTGGPVDAGQTYRVNDGPSGMSLGQEAFLSASGALSLINRPANSLWTPPSKGTVIPAAITSRLKESGALGGGAGVLRGVSDPAVAHLALAVGNLSQEVAELRRKAWNVSFTGRSDGSGLRLAKTTARMF